MLVVDDDPLVRSALALMLGGQEDLEVVGEAGDGRQGVELADRLSPDVVLMDIRMPRLDGLAATRELHTRPDPPRVIVLTTFDADEHVVVGVERRQHDHPRGLGARVQLAGRLEAAEVRHADVHQHHVGGQPVGELHPLAPVAGLADDLEVLLAAQHQCQGRADQGVVVDHEHPSPHVAHGIHP